MKLITQTYLVNKKKIYVRRLINYNKLEVKQQTIKLIKCNYKSLMNN